MRNNKTGGFTIIELMITIVILAIILSFGIPSLTDFFDRRRLIAGAEAMYGELQRARSEAIARSANVTVSFDRDSNTDWNVGMVENDSGCDPEETGPNNSGACALSIDGVNVIARIDASSFEGANFISATGDDDVTFDYTRGMAENKTIVMQSDKGKQIDVVIGIIGRIRMCSPAGATKVIGYPDC